MTALAARNPWANDRATLELYRRRCRREAEEMTCARQAAEVLGPRLEPGETLLDAGCGGGYYFWSFADRGFAPDWHGLDYTPEMVELARDGARAARRPGPRALPARGDRGARRGVRHRPVLQRADEQPALRAAARAAAAQLPPPAAAARVDGRRADRALHARPVPRRGRAHIRVYHNTYPLDEVTAFMEEHGFRVTPIRDERTGDGTEMVVDIPHQWRILLAERR